MGDKLTVLKSVKCAGPVQGVDRKLDSSILCRPSLLRWIAEACKHAEASCGAAFAFTSFGEPRTVHRTTAYEKTSEEPW